MPSKRRGSGGYTESTKTKLDEKGVLIFHVHTRCHIFHVHMRCHIFHVCYAS